MNPNRFQITLCRPPAFSLLETIFMLVALVVFTLLLAGVTKPYWSAGTPPQKSSETAAKQVSSPSGKPESSGK